MTVLLQTQGLVKSFGGFRAVGGVDIAVREGAIHSLIGPNGAGKTTLFYLIAGYIRPTSGSIRFGDAEVGGLPPHQMSRRGVVCAFQITHIFPRLSVLDCVRVALIARDGAGYGFWSPTRRALTARALALLNEVELADVSDQRAGTLSYGDQRMLEVLLALATAPRMLLLDEPTAGMSPVETERVTRLVKRLATERGLTVLLVEHDVNVVFSISDSITVLHQGEVLMEGPPDTVKRDPRVIEVYLGAAA